MTQTNKNLNKNINNKTITPNNKKSMSPRKSPRTLGNKILLEQNVIKNK